MLEHRGGVRYAGAINFRKGGELVGRRTRSVHNMHDLPSKRHNDETKLSYFDLPLWMRPLQVKDMLLGHVIGVKGRLIVLEKDATLYGFDLNNVLGAEVFPIGS